MDGPSPRTLAAVTDRGAGDALAGVLAAASEIATRRGRSDLVDRLEHTRRRLQDSTVRVAVVGDYKSGKSSLVNALVGTEVCPVDDDLATSAITSIAYGPEPMAFLYRQGEGSDPAAGPAPPERLPLESLAAFVEEGAPVGEPIASVLVQAPSPLLATGLELIDTPVLGGLDSPQAVATLMGLPYIDALLFVSDASQEFTLPELGYLRQAWATGTPVICVMTKIDLHPHWRQIVEIDQGHLQRADLHPPVLATSARLQELGYDAESGLPALVDHLEQHVIGPATARRAATAAGEVVAVLDQLESVLRAEQAALTPEEDGPSVEALQATAQRASQLLGESARWRQVLSDGVEDLRTDVHHQLQVRLKDVLHQASVMVDEGDPVSMEEEYSNWVSRQAASVVSDCFQTVSRRGEDLGEAVAAELSSATAELLLPLAPELATAGAEPLAFNPHVSRRAEEHDKVLVAIGASWGGMEPLLGVGALVGLGVGGVVAAPVVLAVAGIAGLLTVGRTFKHERRKQLESERTRVKEGYREYLDEVQVRFTKDLDDAVRALFRQLRDDAAARVAELQTSTQAALEASQRGGVADEAARDQQIQALEVELQSVAALRARLHEDLVPIASGAPGG